MKRQIQIIIFYISSLINQLAMIQRPFSPITNQPFKVQNYYFQIRPIKLFCKIKHIIKANTYYSFTISRLQNNCGSSKQFLLQKNDTLQFLITDVIVNFVAINFNPNKSLVYSLRLNELQDNKIKEIGQYVMDANSFIDKFTQTQNGSFVLDATLSEQWSAQIELYVQKNRYGLQRMIRQIKNPKPLLQNQNQQNIQLFHQRIQEKRKQLDRQANAQVSEAENNHSKKFSKFSPKKQIKAQIRTQIIQPLPFQNTNQQTQKSQHLGYRYPTSQKKSIDNKLTLKKQTIALSKKAEKTQKMIEYHNSKEYESTENQIKENKEVNKQIKFTFYKYKFALIMVLLLIVAFYFVFFNKKQENKMKKHQPVRAKIKKDSKIQKQSVKISKMRK